MATTWKASPARPRPSRPPEAGQPDVDLRQQPDLHRGLDSHRLYRKRAQALRAYGWHVLELRDANDTGDMRRLLEEAKAETSRPTLIIVHSIIGWGAPHLAGTAEAHGAPLGVEEIRETKKFYGWPEDRSFYVPEGVPEHFQAGIATRGAAAARHGMNCSPPTAPNTRPRPHSLTTSSPARCPRAGMPTSRFSTRMRRALPHAQARARCSMRSRRITHGCSVVRPTCRLPPRRT